MSYRIDVGRMQATYCSWAAVSNVVGAVVYQRSGAGNRHFCNLLARIEDHINIIRNFSPAMQYRAVMGVSSLPVVGAKMALSVCTQ